MLAALLCTTLFVQSSVAQSKCLDDAIDSVEWQKFNYSVNGGEMVSTPVRIVTGGWESITQVSDIAAIILTEVMGMQAEVVGHVQGSQFLVRGVAGCQPWDDGNAACNQDLDYPLGHVAYEVWSAADNHMKSLFQAHEYPELLREQGYAGEEGMYVSGPSRESALNGEFHLPLEYYRSYNTNHHEPHVYFDSFEKLRALPLAECSSHGYFSGGYAETYVSATGDEDNVEIKTIEGNQVSAVKCLDDRWFMSAKCRERPETCIPVISNPGGWGFFFFTQWSYFFNMSVALAATTSSDQYATLPLENNILWYWYWPDKTFLDVEPKLIVMPPPSAKEHNQGIFRTGTQASILKAWAWPRLQAENVAAWRFLKAFAAFNKDDMNSLVNGATPCEWVRANREKWDAWVPKGCEQGQGLQPGPHGKMICQICPAGTISKLDGDVRNCAPCPKGHFCSAGVVEPSACPAGTSSSEGMSECERCSIGSYSHVDGMSECIPCPVPFTTPFFGATSPTDCECAQGFYQALVGDGCEECPLGMTCTAGSKEANIGTSDVAPILKAGYWSAQDDPLSIFKCSNEERCPGGDPGSCARGTEGIACAKCVEGHYPSAAECLKCADIETTTLMFPIIPIVLVPVILSSMYWFFRDMPDKWESPANSLAALCFILLNHYQIISMASVANLQLPVIVFDTFKVWAYSEDAISLFKMGCVSGFGNFQGEFLVKMSGPIVLAVLAALTFGGSHAVAKFTKIGVAMDWSRLLNVYFSIVYAFFTGIASTSFSLFKCQTNPNGKDTLMQDLSVICNEDDWNSMVGVGVIAIVVYVGGCLALFGSVIYVAPSSFNDKGFQKRWKFLFIKYRLDTYWWGLAFLAKGVLLNIGPILFTNAPAQLYWMMATAMVYLGIMAMFFPWRTRASNIFEAIVHLSAILIISLLTYFGADDRDDVSDGLGNFTVVASCMPFVFYGAAVAYVMYPRIMGVAVDNTTKAAILKQSMQTLGALEEADISTFLTSLSQPDRLVMQQASQVVNIEMLGARGFKLTTGDSRELGLKAEGIMEGRSKERTDLTDRAEASVEV